MGVYIYKLSRKPQINTPLGGVHVYNFFEKQASWRNSHAQDERVSRYHNGFPVSGPVMIAFDKAEGASVYLQDEARPTMVECESDCGCLVGKLYKESGRWKIFPLRDQRLDDQNKSVAAYAS